MALRSKLGSTCTSNLPIDTGSASLIFDMRPCGGSAVPQVGINRYGA